MNRFFKITICLLAAIMFLGYFTLRAEAAAGGSCGSGVYWSYENGTLTIYGSGRMNNMNSGPQPWNSYSELITNVVIEEGITYIGSDAFYEMAAIKTVSLPNTLTGIGSYAFCWAESIQEIDIPANVKIIEKGAFWCCLDLTEVTFHEGLVEIKDEAFTFCRLLTNLSFPESLEKIGYWAFGDCTDLEYVSMPGVKSLGASCFSGCQKLQTVELCSELEDINTSAFAYCFALKDIVIPGSVQSIGDTAFYLCEVLNTVKFTGSVPEISASAFAGTVAAAFYPECNTEWENVIYENFGGTLSWSSYSVDGHAYEETVVEPGCLRWGYTFHNCTDCGEYYMDNYYSALGHDWDGGTVSGNQTVYVCERCGFVRYEHSVSGSCGSNARWSLDTEEGILNITGTGGITSNSGFKSYKTSIRHVVIGSGITSIGAETFFEFENIESIEIPKTVTYIGMQAFVWCRNLKSLAIPEGVTAIYEGTFWGCQSLETLILPSTLKSIGKDCFYYCESLKKLYIPDSVTQVDELAFWYCLGLEEVNIPKGLTELPKDMFSSCTSLKKVTFHDNVKVIGEDAFSGCSALSEIILPDSVHTIVDYAFWGCKSLKEIVIPGSVMNLGYAVFGNCTNLKTVKFTGNPPAFDENAFGSLSASALYRSGNSDWTSSVKKQYGGTITWKTYSITGHIFESSVKEPGCEVWGYTKYSCIDCSEYYMDYYTDPVGHDWEFTGESGGTSTYTCRNCGEIKKVYERSGYCGSNLRWTLNTEEGILRITGTGSMNSMGRTSQPWNSYINSIKKVIIESGATSIGSYAFYEHPNLVSVEIPNTIRTIGLGAFCWSQLLEEITIPEGVTSIPEDCFWACSSLKTINLPSTIKTIGQGAFYSTAISSVYLADGITDIGEDAFWYCTKLQSVKIPKNVKILRETIFASCSSLKTVTLHDGITEIQRSAFSSCSSLSSITLPKNLKKIGQSAFSGAKISKITIPENVSSIDGYVFGGYLKEIHFLGNAPEFDAKTFNGLTLTAYYPGYSASWSYGKCQNYGGTVTWKTEECQHLLIEKTVIEPTCLDEGYTECVCCVCDYYYYDSYTDPTGHSLGEWETTLEPTERELGEQQRHCHNCDYYESRIITAAGYEIGDINLDGSVNVMDAYYARLVAAKLIVPTEEQIQSGDVDRSGKITAIDANMIRKYIVKIINSLPVNN